VPSLRWAAFFMSEGLALLALVPARGGSKRVPRKNVLPLAGKPLIAWSIETAFACNCFADVLVSTDDAEIAAVAAEHGAYVPWLRPAELATDAARSGPVIRHALSWYTAHRREIDAIVLLQPTSPFRSTVSVRRAIAQYAALESKEPVVSVSPAAVHPAWCFTLSGGAMTPVLGWQELDRRSQDLPKAYALNGAIYVFPAAHILADRPLISAGTQALVMDDPDESLDIDTETDWRRATEVAQRLAART
jgi:CMP-N,N'-diacetyllegionaminic acid synthase